MRIVAGRYRGVRLDAPEGDVTRPTSDRAREALFNILSNEPYRDALLGGRVLDLFAGTGALGLESLSRGAALCHHYETDRAALAALRRNIEKCRAGELSTIVSADAYTPGAAPSRSAPSNLARFDLAPFDLALVDPPYAEGAVERALVGLTRPGLLDDQAFVVAQVHPKTPISPPSGFIERDDRRYGAARFLILERAAPF